MTSLWQSVRLSPIKPLWVSSLYLRSSLCVRANNYSPLRPASAHPSYGGSSSPDRKRRSIRLRRYDYTQTGAYFITMCTQNRRHRFGTIVAGTMVLNEAARFANDCWRQMPDHFPNIELAKWVVMPNYIPGGIAYHRGHGTWI